jgi:hypothetical protein
MDGVLRVCLAHFEFFDSFRHMLDMNDRKLFRPERFKHGLGLEAGFDGTEKRDAPALEIEILDVDDEQGGPLQGKRRRFRRDRLSGDGRAQDEQSQNKRG